MKQQHVDRPCSSCSISCGSAAKTCVRWRCSSGACDCISTSNPCPDQDHRAHGDVRPLFRAIVEGDHEGIVAKRIDARYRAGPPNTWLKIKNRNYSRRGALSGKADKPSVIGSDSAMGVGVRVFGTLGATSLTSQVAQAIARSPPMSILAGNLHSVIRVNA